MSIECRECESDLRGGHAKTCSQRQLAPNRKPANGAAAQTIKRTHEWHKSYDQIKEQCIQLGLALSDRLYLNGQSDFVVVEGGGARVYYSSSTGHFFGTTDQGVEFASDLAQHDDEPWFQALLDFFLWNRKAVTPDEVPA